LYAGCGGCAIGRAGAFSGAPQLSQNASPGIADAPHCGQVTAPEVAATAGAATAGGIGAAGCVGAAGAATGAAATGINAAPHWSQKRAFSGLSIPHWGQKGMFSINLSCHLCSILKLHELYAMISKAVAMSFVAVLVWS
jgi:hypothetical protein